MADADSDEALLERIAGGDAPAFSELARRHGSRVLALARHMLGSAADAQDVVQDVFIRLWQQAGRWESRGAKLSTWLHRVTVNLCLDHIERVQKRMTPFDPVDHDIADPAVPADEQLSEHERLAVLQVAIGALPERQRAALAMFYTAGASTAETADALGLSVKATESLLVRARQALRSRLSARVEACT